MIKKNKKGFMFPVVLIIIVFLVVIVNSVTTLGTSNSITIANSAKRDKAYYVAYSGLQMIFSGMYRQNPDHTEIHGKSIIESTGKEGPFKKERKNVINISKEDPLLIQDNGNVFGYCEIHGDLLKDKGGQLYYKIVCIGRLKKDSSSPSDSHTLTMIIIPEEDQLPKIYDGVK